MPLCLYSNQHTHSFSLTLFVLKHSIEEKEKEKTEHVFFVNQMAKSSPHMTRYTFITLLFIFLFLLSIFLFNKRNLEPSLSLYRNFFSQTDTHISLPESTSPDSVPDPDSETESKQPKIVKESPHDELSVESGGVITGDNGGGGDRPISLNSETESEESKIVKESSHDGFSVENERNPIAGNESGGGDRPISPNSETESKESKIVKESSHDGFSVENERNSVADNESGGATGDNGGDLSKERVKMCDLYKGTWVRDEEYPIYKPGSCPYVDEAFNCQGNGRRDSDYLKWRWKPDGCDLPRFNATDFLERLRGKRLMMVGDSMNRNQYESILCLLREGLPDKSKMYEIHGHKISKGRGYFVFKFVDYGCTVEFVRSHFLVKEGIRINGQGHSNPTLSIDQIDKTSGRWKRADILVFNTGHWWTHGKTARGKNYYKEGGYLYPQFDAVEAYRRALRTWAKWIDQNVKRSKQLVFYRGYSSAHFRGGDWDSGGSCNGETEPILRGAFLDNYPLKMKIVEEVIQEMRFPVILLNATRLTNFRKDGHPSIYGKNVTDGRKVSTRRQDCSHWCLPGVPDAWNELIYASLVFQQTPSKS